MLELKIFTHLIKKIAGVEITISANAKQVIKTYAVETYSAASSLLFFERLSANLFFNPLPIPISNKEIHCIMEIKIDQIPYFSFPKLLKRYLTLRKVTIIENPLIKRVKNICRIIFAFLPCASSSLIPII